VALHPAFKDEEVERIRKQRLVAILQEGDQPIASALRVGSKALYGDQPYGFRPVGTTDSVKAMTRADMAGFWTAHYTPKDAALIVAGDVTEAEAKRLAEKYFGGWSSTSAAASATLPAPPSWPAD
jgi:zinc protease